MNLDPARTYPLIEAAKLIPSPQGGTISVQTLRAWARQGLYEPVVRQVGRRKYLFVRGEDLLRLALAEAITPVVPPIRSKAQQDEALAGARRKLAALGVKGKT
jgi:hypothetical protein